MTITPEGQSAEDIELSATTDGASSPPSRAGRLILLAFPENVAVRKCAVGAYCQSTTAKSLAGIGIPLNKSADKKYSFVISNAHIGFSSNGESALAYLPTVFGKGPATGDETLIVTYRVQDASAYDWSVPPFDVSAGIVGWSEPLIVSSSSALTAEAQPSEITGINHAAEAQDNRDTFISGILLGVAGAAAIAAAQEGLHLLFDDRSDGTPRKLRRTRTQSG